MEFVGKPNLLVFPKVTGRAVSIMREVAGPGSLFLFPKAIIEGRLESDLEVRGNSHGDAYFIPVYSVPLRALLRMVHPHPFHQHGQAQSLRAAVLSQMPRGRPLLPSGLALGHP